ncbi:MAG: type I glutamate--ammonia ligase [Thermodesulfobacteriota bacterium]|nr:type I glutamate--ammonia ligase [Thermodesulfobacteriota bacterium]|tara:strand:+ start:704 stop:2122 length:1419 start_codon:yes stop_codon:yes gene_type:complete
MGYKVNDVLKLIKSKKVEFVDLRFCDLLGTWQHTSFPASEIDAGVFKDGLGFDGSSIRAWQDINNSDMLIIPDPATAVLDPFTSHPTLSIICDIKDAITKQRYDKDPRYVATKAENYLKKTGVGDKAFFGPELEFFIFDDVRYEFSPNQAFHSVDSVEGEWNSGEDEVPNLGHKIRYKEGYFPTSPNDTYQDVRSEMVSVMQDCGLTVECHHHEVGGPGQAEIDMKFAPLKEMADNVMWYKYIVKNVAKLHGKSATFMPKPVYVDNGSGMHVHQSIWKGSSPLFAGKKYAGLSDTALHYVGGVLKHARAICAFSNSTINSYKRLVPGYEAPIILAHSARNRSAAIRIPMYSESPKAKRIETRFPDPAGNCYLIFSALLMAGLDGIRNKIKPTPELEKDIYSLSERELNRYPSVPAALDEALDALKKDHKFLLEGGVFTEDLIEAYINYKMDEEITPWRARPNPFEFVMYYSV